MHRIGFIGAGKMAFALAKAMEKNGMVESLIMSDRNDERLKFIRKNTVSRTTSDNSKVVRESDIIFVAVKPQDISLVLNELKVKDQIIISIAAGITINQIESVIGKDKRIVRVMPNTPCLVSEMAAAYSINKQIDEQDENIVHGLLNAAGLAVKVKEEELDIVTALSGSGPGFFAQILKQFIDSAVEEGLSEILAKALAYQTMIGTGKLLLEKNITPEELVEMVASPNGTTVAGLNKLKKAEAVLKNVIKSAYIRSKELGKNE